MSYFNNPKTEEELKQQFRNLLIKYDYQSNKNADIINKIYAEYQELQMSIKRANGYRTVSERVVDGAKNMISEAEKARIKEENRVNQMKNRVYTMDEMKDLINQTKECIKTIICSQIEHNTSYYNTIVNKEQYGTEHITRWFNLNSEKLAFSQNQKRKYDSVREKLEYAMKSQAKTKGDEESYMIQMERALGKYILHIFKTEVVKAIDPIDFVANKVQAEKSVKENKKMVKLGLLVMMLVVVFYSFVALINEGIESAILLFFGASILIGILFGIWYGITVLTTKAVTKTYYTWSGSGIRRKKSRMSEQKEYQSERNKGRLIRTIFHIFR